MCERRRVKVTFRRQLGEEAQLNILLATNSKLHHNENVTDLLPIGRSVVVVDRFLSGFKQRVR